MPEDIELKKNISNIKQKLMVISGKGGVGKTTISVNLAYALSLKGYKVGLLDVDIHGPNVVKLLGIENKRLTGSGDSKINPIELSDSLKVMSTASMLEDSDTPVIWRGPLKMKIISQFLRDVNWGKLDYLIIDSPPGTGDEPLSVAQLIKDLSGAIVVTTPQEVAMLDSRKSIQFAKKLNIPYIGIIENMSGFICPYCGKEINLFNKGGGKKAAAELGIDFLGDIPIDKEIVDLSDSGKAFVKYGNMDSIAFKKIEKVVGNIESVFNSNRNRRKD
jgi:ATP-binding protein involved in chromosome partitioning